MAQNQKLLGCFNPRWVWKVELYRITPTKRLKFAAQAFLSVLYRPTKFQVKILKGKEVMDVFVDN